MSSLSGFAGWLLLFLVAGAAAAPAEGRQAPVDLTGLSLEELMHVEVTLVSRRPERWSEAAAAIAVVTGEDIHRESIPNRGLCGLFLLHRGPVGGLHAWGSTITGSNAIGTAASRGVVRHHIA